VPFQTVAVPPLAAEPSPFQVRVALVQAHQAALGDLQRLGKVRLGSSQVAPVPVQGGSGQEAAGKVIFTPSPPQAFHGMV
jgi:hypothetical protein